MFGKAKKRIRELEQTLEYYKGMCEGLESRITQVVEQNERLMDRLMSTNFQEYSTFTLNNKIQLPEPEYDPTSDDEMAGEILDGE